MDFPQLKICQYIELTIQRKYCIYQKELKRLSQKNKYTRDWNMHAKVKRQIEINIHSIYQINICLHMFRTVVVYFTDQPWGPTKQTNRTQLDLNKCICRSSFVFYICNHPHNVEQYFIQFMASSSSLG